MFHNCCELLAGVSWILDIHCERHGNRYCDQWKKLSLDKSWNDTVEQVLRSCQWAESIYFFPVVSGPT